jgi:hypothetical protein
MCNNVKLRHTFSKLLFFAAAFDHKFVETYGIYLGKSTIFTLRFLKLDYSI